MNWVILSALILTAGLSVFFISFEKNSSIKEMTLIATLAAFAAVSRVPFAVIMSFQPTTFIVMITGYVFGPRAGFLTGATAALVSNFFLGQGPWTPWQMLCWGLCGLVGALLGKGKTTFNKPLFITVSFLCGFMYGWLMNIWHWIGFVYPLNISTFIATYIASIPFDTMHASGNVLFSGVLGSRMFIMLSRFKKRFSVERITTGEVPCILKNEHQHN